MKFAFAILLAIILCSCVNIPIPPSGQNQGKLGSVQLKLAASYIPYIDPDKPTKNKYDAIIIAVAHDEFKSLTEDQIRTYGKDKHVLYDIKYLLKARESDGRL